MQSDYQKQGLGRELSLRSLEQLHRAGALAVVCHAWVESPENSSVKYLDSLKFEKVKRHRNFWFFKEYDCTRCAPNKCECSADEMIYYLPIEAEEDDIIPGTR